MPSRLVRFQQTGDIHFITFSCHQRRPYLKSPTRRNIFEQSLEDMRVRYRFLVFGYVVMPEHVHLLISEPSLSRLDRAIHAIKLSVASQLKERPFWLVRYYDFNVRTEKKRTEKLRYMHRNPVVRGLVSNPEDWRWSSFNHYATGQQGPVEIESQWTATRRGHQLPAHLRFKQKPNAASPVSD